MRTADSGADGVDGGADGAPSGAAETPVNVADLVRDAARATPHASALIGPWGVNTWSELDRAVDVGVARLGADLRGRTVVLALPTGPELAAALFAVLRVGAIAVPVAPDVDDLPWVARRTGAAVVIDDGAAVASWWTEAVGSVDGAPGQAAAAHSDAEVPAGGEDLALLARASRPGPPVMLSHRALVAAAHATAAAMELHAADRVLQALPLFHVVGLVTAFLPTALAGAAIVVPDTGGGQSRAEWALAAVREHRVSVLPAEPNLFRQLDRETGFERALATVRLMTSGSSPLDPVDFAALRAATGQAVREGYGISEAASAIASTLLVPTAQVGTVGRPYPGVEIRIENHLAAEAAEALAAAAEAREDQEAPPAEPTAEQGDAPAPADTALRSSFEGLVDTVDTADPSGGLGRIAIRGDTLFSGYWPDGFGGPGADGWFVTGDIGYLDDYGNLHLVDRADETVTVAGFTVYPREVEDALVAHPLVADAAVVGVPGRAGQTVVAVLVPKPGTRPTAADVSEFVAGRLPPFKRPTDYLLAETLPRTEVGRLDRATVRRQFAAERGLVLGVAPLATVAGGADQQEEGSSPERAADLGSLGRRLPGGSNGARRGAHDTDEDLF